MRTFYHGTDRDTAVRFIAGEPLDPARAAAAKVDGDAGFYLACEVDDAIAFAVRRALPTLLNHEVSEAAFGILVAAGAILRPIRLGRMASFDGPELFVPPGAFSVFNRLLASGETAVDFDP